MSKRGFFAAKKAGLKIRHWKKKRKGDSGGREKSRAAYRRHLESSYWKEVKVLIYKRDGMICCMCKFLAINPQVHHVTYKHIFKEKDCLTDLILLCENCHKKLHKIIK